MDALGNLKRTHHAGRVTADLTGQTVTVTGWAETAPVAEGLPVEHDPTTGVWTVAVPVPERGWATVAVDAG